MDTIKKLLLPIFILVCSFYVVNKADYISLIQADKCENIVEIFIEEGQIRITFELGQKDFQWFKNIIPQKYYPDGYTEKTMQECLLKYFNENFIVEINGKILVGKVIKTEKIKRIMRSSLYTGKVDTTSIASPEVIFVEVVYSFKGKPKRISLTPPLKDGYDVTFANIGFVVYHNTIPLNDLRYLGTTEYINLDWNDPWYSYFDNKNIRRHHNSSIMSYLYIDPYEVRHEVLSRIKDLDYWIDINYKLGDYIEVEEQEELKNKIANFLAERNKIIIDGVEVEPIVDKVHFVTVAMSGIQIMQIPERLNYSSAIIGVIFAYPNPGIPKEVTIEWDLFNDNITQVPNTATDPAGPMKYILQPNDSILVWKNFLKKYKLPTITEVEVTNASFYFPYLTIFILIFSLVLLIKNRKEIFDWVKKKKIILLISFIIGLVSLPIAVEIEIPFLKKEGFSKPEAKVLIDQLLKNTYRAFDFRDESDVYDKLEISNTGDLLTEIYIQTKKGMVLENQGGIQVKVKELNIMDVIETDADREGISYNCKWTVKGSVGHWGHIHNRINKYNAVLSIKPVNGVWKVHNIDMIEESRLL